MSDVETLRTIGRLLNEIPAVRQLLRRIERESSDPASRGHAKTARELLEVRDVG